MGFLENMQARNVIGEKAAMFDQLMEQGKQQAIYQQGQADREGEIAQGLAQLQSKGMMVPPQEPTPIPEGVNVTNEEMARAQSILGYQPTMEDIMQLRKLDSLQQMQGSIGAAPDMPVQQPQEQQGLGFKAAMSKGLE